MSIKEKISRIWYRFYWSMAFPISMIVILIGFVSLLGYYDTPKTIKVTRILEVSQHKDGMTTIKLDGKEIAVFRTDSPDLPCREEYCTHCNK